MRPLSVAASGLSRALDWLFWSLVLLAALSLVLTLAPGVAGRQLLAVAGGSMEPALSAGDGVLTRPATGRAGVSTGEIVLVATAEDRALVAHRVLLVATGADGETLLKTGGDFNPQPDPGWARLGDVQARVEMVVPGLGWLLRSLAQPLSRFALFVVPLLYLAARELIAGLQGEEVPA